MSELKPCPFCGGKAELYYDRNLWSVECSDCRTQSGVNVTEEKVINAWNTRREAETKAQAVFLGADFTSDYLKEVGAQAVEEAAKAMQQEYDNCGDENLMRSQNLYYSALQYGANWLDRYAQQLRDSN